MGKIDAEKVVLHGAMETLLITLNAKARNSRLADPILGDTMAAALADRIDYDFGKFSTNDTVAYALRAKQLDRWTAEFLAEYGTATRCIWVAVWTAGCSGLTRRARFSGMSSTIPR